MSPDGHSFSFDSRGNGYVRCEGAGIVVLKTLTDALNNHDRIYAVIRGSGVNHDGNKPAITNPRQATQQRLLERVCRESHTDPATIVYSEAHGTGTVAGDKTEAAALSGALCQCERARPLYIGSLKSNFGHMEGAAGVASLIKGGRRSCMARPKIDYIPKGLTVDLEEAYAGYFKQEVEFRPENKEDFLYMLRLLERWEKKSIPAVLAKGRPDAAYAIAMGLCEHLPLLIYREDIRDYLNDYKLRIGKLIYASFAALVDSVAAWNNEEKREEVFTYIFTHLSRFDGFKRVQNNIQMLAPSKKFGAGGILRGLPPHH